MLVFIIFLHILRIFAQMVCAKFQSLCCGRALKTDFYGCQSGTNRQGEVLPVNIIMMLKGIRKISLKATILPGEVCLVTD